MKIWRLDSHDEFDGHMVEWFPSRAAALKHRAEIRRIRETDPYIYGDPEPLIIPTDKAGLTKWLNNHFNTDNG